MRKNKKRQSQQRSDVPFRDTYPRSNDTYPRSDDTWQRPTDQYSRSRDMYDYNVDESPNWSRSSSSSPAAPAGRPAYAQPYRTYEQTGQYGRLSHSPQTGLQDQDGANGRGQDFSGRGPKGYRRSDERIKEETSDTLTQDPRVDAAGIEVSVKNGVVTMSGTVPDRRMKRLAEDAIESSPGIEDVRNELRVSSSHISSGHKTKSRSARKERAMGPSML